MALRAVVIVEVIMTRVVGLVTVHACFVIESSAIFLVNY